MPNLAAVLQTEIRKAVALMGVGADSRTADELKKLRQLVDMHTRVLARLERRIGAARKAGARAASSNPQGGAPWGRKAGAVAAEAKAAGLDPKALLAFRTKTGLSRVDFAAVAGVSPGSIFLWESGRAVPRGASLDKLKTLMQRGSARGKSRR